MKNIVSRAETSIIVELENCSRIIEPFIEPKSHLKLTLPDYKLCSSIGPPGDTTVLHNISRESHNIQEDNTSCNTISYVPKEQFAELEEPKIDNTKENKISDSDKKNVCPICRKGFTSKVWFAKHMVKEHNGKKYSCTKCDKSKVKYILLRVCTDETSTNNMCKFL